MTTAAEAAGVIRGAERVVLATHVSPDPDAIGSTLALGLALEGLGHEVVLLCDDPVPAYLRFLPGSSRFRKSLPEGFAPGVLVGVDSSDAERLGKAAGGVIAAGVPVVNIDHHVTNLNYGMVNLVDPRCAAAAELLLPLIEALGAPITPEVATCLLAGLVGDTRSFSTASVTPGSLQTAARLVEAGADIAVVTEEVFNRRTVDVLRMWGLALSRLSLEDGVIWTSIPSKEREQLGLSKADATGMSNLLLSAEEANISAVLLEQNGGSVEISFRARPGYDVASVALELGGGGHPLAAGCTIDGPLEEAARRVLALLRAQIRSAGQE